MWRVGRHRPVPATGSDQMNPAVRAATAVGRRLGRVSSCALKIASLAL